ncbi:type IV secretory system conjugative DNA transfer family protein [Amycolatopsis sp. NPDC051716]|uniref:type IV secretory system conjugative DNA transfer family protein n=1 Tax=Amycolatopsis sp. NPDC051716 TaxID=3155804 RepID=UPI003428CF94
MTALIFCFILALVPLAVLVSMRFSDARKWQNSLVAYRIQPPATLNANDVAAWLAAIQAQTHPSWLSLFLKPPICVEVVSRRDGLSFYVLASREQSAALLSSLRGALHGVRISEAPEYLTTRPNWQLAAEATMTNPERPLAPARAEITNAALLAALQPVIGENTEIRLQWILVSAGTPSPVRSAPSSGAPSSWAFERTLPEDAEAVQAARVKIKDPLLYGVARIGVATENDAQARALFGRVWNTLHGMNAPGVRIRRRVLPSDLVIERLTRRSYPLGKWPLTVSTTEGAGLLGLPITDVALPGLSLGSARQLPAPPHLPTRGQIIGMSNYPGMTERPLALTPEDRTRHSYIVGPSGSGKSVLLTRLIVSDIQSGYGVFAVDPKGDLISGVLERLTPKQAENVIVLDASKRSLPVGLNVLGHAGTEEARELAVDNVLHTFREIWSSFWGPRTDQVLRSALTALVHVPARDGSAMTICEVVPLLTNPQFRTYVTEHPALPQQLRSYWQRFGRLSDNEMAQYVGPVLNKVEAFTQRVPIRLMLGQSNGVDFTAIFRERKTVLVNLAKGELGTETGNLLGALVISELWKATVGRIKVSPEKRRPCFAYVDEAQDIVRLPLAIADMLAQARGFKVGFTLANQYIAQLPETVRAAVLGTVRTQIAFAVEHEDAQLLEKRFGPLTADDLTGLAAFEFAMRPCVDARTLAPVTGTSLPLSEPLTDAAAVATQSRQRHGMTRADVEAGLTARVELDGDDVPAFGRRQRGGSA